jgi:hypothetical protein
MASLRAAVDSLSQLAIKLLERGAIWRKGLASERHQR